MNHNELTIHSHFDDLSWIEEYRNFIHQVLLDLVVIGYDFSITFCSDREIQELNLQYRGKNEPTDVLSFEAQGEPGQENWVLGDLVISLDTLRANSVYFNEDPEVELKRLTIHGILHLIGWDHKTNDPIEPMLLHQEEILTKYKKESWF